MVFTQTKSQSILKFKCKYMHIIAYTLCKFYTELKVIRVEQPNGKYYIYTRTCIPSSSSSGSRFVHRCRVRNKIIGLRLRIYSYMSISISLEIQFPSVFRYKILSIRCIRYSLHSLYYMLYTFQYNLRYNFDLQLLTSSH